MKKTHFSVTLQIDPIWFDEDIFGDIFYFYKQKIWNVADGMPLKWCKRNWNNINGLSEKMIFFFLYAFLFFVRYIFV